MLALGIFLAPSAAAAGFAAEAAFAPFPPEETLSFLSGSMAAAVTAETGAYGFLELRDELTITGVTRVCGEQVVCSATNGAYKIVVAPGGSVGLHFPDPTSGQAAAAHAIAFTADLSTVERGELSDLSDYRLGPSLVALTVEGAFSFGPIPAIEETLLTTAADSSTAAGLASLSDTTTVTIYQGTQVYQTLSGKGSLAFQGKPAIGPIAADGLLLPFQSGGLTMARADADAAARGLDIAALGASIERMQSALMGEDAEPVEIDLGVLNPVASRVLNGAFVDMPTQAAEPGEVLQEMELVRFESLAGRADDGSLRMTGEAPLAIQGGRVQSADEMVGFGYAQMPWWSWLLWVLAIAAFVTRLVRKSPKRHPKWDKLRWVGWVAGGVLGMLLSWLWDRRFNDVFGVSVLDGASGETLLPVMLVEFGTLLLVVLAVVLPIRILAANGLRLAKQGTFMGLAGPFALLAGIVLGGGLLLSYLDLVLKGVGGA
jgi:hypothetical protein